jgi:hypothetical protein
MATTTATLTEIGYAGGVPEKLIFTTPTGPLVWETATPLGLGEYTVTFTKVEKPNEQPRPPR